jgi:hypothetical protein
VPLHIGGLKNVMAIFQHHHHRKQARTLENEEDKSHALWQSDKTCYPTTFMAVVEKKETRTTQQHKII